MADLHTRTARVETLPRVFMPGDALPVGIWVMGRDHVPSKTWCEGAVVDPKQPYALVEVSLPDYDRAFQIEYARRFHRADELDPPQSGGDH